MDENKEKKILTKKQLDNNLKNIEGKTKKNLESIEKLKNDNFLLDLKRKDIYYSYSNDTDISKLIKTLPSDIINIILKYYSLDNPLYFLVNKTSYKFFDNSLYEYQITNIMKSIEDQLRYYNIVVSYFKFKDFFKGNLINTFNFKAHIKRERRMFIIFQLLFNKFLNILSYTNDLNNEKTSKWSIKQLKSNKVLQYNKEINIVLDKDGRIFNLSEFEYNWMRKLICEIFNDPIHKIIFGTFGNRVVYGIKEKVCTYISFV